MFEFDGKYFSILSFRKVKVKSPKKRRIKVIYVTQTSSTLCVSNFSQTLLQRRNISVQSQSIVFGKSSQTVPESRESKKSQATVITSAEASQTDEKAFKTKSTQTDAEKILVPQAMAPPLEADGEEKVSQQEVQTICYLNKIGEGLVSQNGLIQNNSTLLTKVADFICLLKDPVLKQNDQPQLMGCTLL